jgi:hypothetical protein
MLAAALPSPKRVRLRAMHPSREMANMLRDALTRVELSIEISPDDTSLGELRRLLLLKIAALEATARGIDSKANRA